VGVSEDSRDISGEACWDQLSSLHVLKLVDIMENGTLSRRTDNPMSTLNVGRGCKKQCHVPSFTKRVILLISQFFVHE